jgi:hypothetical protein
MMGGVIFVVSKMVCEFFIPTWSVLIKKGPADDILAWGWGWGWGLGIGDWGLLLLL